MLITADDDLEQTRPYAVRLVEREERRTGSRMRAYESVASTIGVSDSWVRKLIGRQPVTVSRHQWLNLKRTYDDLCARIDQASEHNERRAAALREAAHAAHQSAGEVVAISPEPDRS